MMPAASRKTISGRWKSPGNKVVIRNECGNIEISWSSERILLLIFAIYFHCISVLWLTILWTFRINKTTKRKNARGWCFVRRKGYGINVCNKIYAIKVVSTNWQVRYNKVAKEGREIKCKRRIHHEAFFIHATHKNMCGWTTIYCLVLKVVAS